jgi:hypothetical protein
MNNIFDIKFTFEQKAKDEVIIKFSNKQGGDYNVFAYHWQCFAWAAIIGFLRNERRPIAAPIADRPFSLTTMRNNNGEKIAEALICLCIAKSKSLDIMKTPEEAIDMINEYANGGFYHIMKLMQNGENTFNDLEKVKQEIFNRDLIDESLIESSDLNTSLEFNVNDLDEPTITPIYSSYVNPEEEYSTNQNEPKQDVSTSKDDPKEEINSHQNDPEEEISKPVEESSSRKDKPKEKQHKTKIIEVCTSSKWKLSEERDAVSYFEKGMTISQLSKLFGKDEDSIIECLKKHNCKI